MISVEIKINDDVIKRVGAVRQENFRGEGATHRYEVFMIVQPENAATMKPDIYPAGFVDHRYCAGAVSLAEKMLCMVRRRGMAK